MSDIYNDDQQSNNNDDVSSSSSSLAERKETEDLARTHEEYKSDEEEDDPESQKDSTFTSLINRASGVGGHAYENVYTTDEEYLDPDDLMAPLNSRKSLLIRNWLLLPLGMIFVIMTFFLGVIFILSINDINPTSFILTHSVRNVPEDLAHQCSSNELTTLPGWEKCKKTCNVAKCCIVPLNHKGSCLQKYEVQCSKFYHYCKVMFDADGVPPASTTTSMISSVVTPQNPEFDSQGQVDGKEHDSSMMMIPPAPRDIGLICSTTNLKSIEGFSECEKVCLPAACCTSSTCSQNTGCIGYSVCMNLKYSSHVSTPTLLQNVCGYKTLSTEGRSKCEAACKLAQCCFDGNDCTSNINLVINCMEYERCFFLYEDETTSLSAQQQQIDDSAALNNDLTPSDKIYLVNEACTFDMIATDNGRTACYDLCSERSCCFLSEWSSCYKDKHDWCEEYKPCELLLSSNINQKEAGSADNNNALVNGPSINDICSNAAMSTTQGIDACHLQCNIRSCCFSSGLDTCYDEYSSWCDEYHICSTIQQSIDLTPGNPNVELTVKDLAHTLDVMTQACRQDVTPPYHLEDGAKCHSYCQDLKCCFSQGADDGCYDRYEDYCDQFKMCGAMYDNNSNTNDYNDNKDIINKPDPSFQEFCSEQYIIQNGQIDCENKCHDRECCFIPEQNKVSCFLKNRSWCEEYVPCTKLDKYNGKGNNNKDKNKNNKEDDNDDIVSLVKQACYVSPDKASTTGYAKCANLCQSRMCCFQNDDNLSCYKDKTDWCEEFSACYKLNINDLIGIGVFSGSSSTSNNKESETELEVEDACSKDSLKTISGMANCGKLCADKHCCSDSFPPSLKKPSNYITTTTSSCTKETCEEYKSCQSFFDQTSDDKPKLESLCTHDEISDNYNTCSKICSQRSCCFQWGNEGNCYSNNEIWCDEFHPCYNLNWVDVSKEHTSELISEACSKMNIITEAGRERCLALCEDHTCCFSETDDNCYKQETEFCVGYESCSNLYISPHEMVEEFCDKGQVDTSLGYSVCSILCESRKCCFQKDATSCSKNFESWCNEFSACENLGGIENFMELDKDQSDGYIVYDICSKNSLLEGVSGRNDCQDICSERYCCFVEGRMSCYDKKREWCEEFEACTNLETISFTQNNNQISSPTTNGGSSTSSLPVDKMCDKSNLRTSNGVKACERTCQDRNCCFSMEYDNCYIEKKDWCDQYQACKNLDSMKNANDMDQQQQIQDKEEDNKFDINNICSDKSLLSTEGLDKCKVACEFRACCFARETGLNCWDEHPQLCASYESCQNLMMDDDDDDDDDDVDDYISDPEITNVDIVKLDELCMKDAINTADNYNLCKQICNQRPCCFHWGKESCAEERYDYCDEFRLCYNLDWADFAENESEKQTGDLKFVIHEACSTLNILTEAGRERCDELCEDRDCCYEKNSSLNCRLRKKDWCDGYDACSNLNMKTTDMLEEFCTADKVESGLGYAVCDVLCTTRPCCFVEGPGNCEKKYPAWCKEMDICTENLDMPSIMRTYNGKTDANIVGRVCGNVHLLPEEDVGVKDCRELCSERACCFLPGRDNCSKTFKDWCDEFSSCKNLNLFYMDDLYADDDNDEIKDNRDDKDKIKGNKDDNDKIKDNKDDNDKIKDITVDNPGDQNPDPDNDNKEIESKMDDICSDNNISTPTGREKCEETCEEHACCYALEEGLNCWDEHPLLCTSYRSCQNLMYDYNVDIEKLNAFCTKDAIDNDDNYNTCRNICSARECCFHWGKENCVEEKEDWCDDFRLCYNLDWADFAENESEKQTGDLKFVVNEACSKLNVLTEAGRDRCEEICDERECCFNSDLTQNCWSTTPELCEEYEPCSNLNLKDEDLLEIFCSKDKVVTGLGYSVCSVLCTTRPCCFVEGPGNCAKEFPSWCSGMEICAQNLDMPSIMKSYNGKTDANIVGRVCGNVHLLPEEDVGVKDCRELCSERACCFLPGRDNCSKTFKDWCDEFSSCENLNLFYMDDFYADDDNDEIKDNRDDKDKIKGNKDDNDKIKDNKDDNDKIKDITVDNPGDQNPDPDNYNKEIESKMDDICSDNNISTPTGREKCEETCEEHACCYALEEGLNCWDEHPLLCTSYRSCQNLMYDYNVDIDKLNAFCTKDAINNDDNYNTCKDICSTRECCFHWGKENCVEEKEDWCDDFRLCYNLDWADVAANANPGSSAKDDLLFVVNEACSKLNLLTEAGRDRCDELCEERECCFDSDLTQNCWKDTPELCDGYEPCSNLNLKDEDLLGEFCSKDKVATGLGYAICEVLCTSRPCCYLEGEKNCVKKFPKWCSGIDICSQNLDMPFVMKNYDTKTDGNIVKKICSNVELLPKGHEGIKDCKELCSERGCCFLPGRDNCSNKYADWCIEFNSCGKLNLFEMDDHDDDEDEYYDKDKFQDKDEYQDDDRNKQMEEVYFQSTSSPKNNEEEVYAQSTSSPKNNEDAVSLPPVQIAPTGLVTDAQVNALCTKENIKTETGRYNCENFCKERSCCFLVSFGNCYTSSQEWCDEYKACENLFFSS